jgi:hypothetical protein
VAIIAIADPEVPKIGSKTMFRTILIIAPAVVIHKTLRSRPILSRTWFDKVAEIPVINGTIKSHLKIDKAPEYSEPKRE